MANVDYGQVRQERIWITRETTFNTQKQPTARDAVILRGRATLPAVLTDRVKSEELRPEAPDTDQLINRKKPPGAFELPFYAKATAIPGALSQWATLLLNIMGIEQTVLEVLSFAGLAPGKTVTITIDGVATVLTEGSGWTAAGSNATTATSLAAAIHAIAGVSAVAQGAEVLITRDAGVGDVAVTSNALATALSMKEIRYKLATDILEQSLTITHLADNFLRHFRGCHASAVAWEVSGSDEGTMRFTGWLGNEVQCGYHTLNATINAAVTALVVTEEPRALVGPNVDDVVYIQIDSEIIKVTAIDYATKTFTVVRGQSGTTAASHTAGAVISPVFPAGDPVVNDTIIPMTLGVFDVAGSVYRIAEATAGDDEHLEPRIDEWGEPALTGYRRPLAGRDVTVEFTAYQRATILALEARAELGTQGVVTMTIGKAGITPQIILNFPRFQFVRPEIGERGGEFSQTFTGMGLASSSPGNDGMNVVVRPV